MDSPIDDRPETLRVSEARKPGGRVPLAIGFGWWVLLGFSSFSAGGLFISFAFSIAGLICAVGKLQRIFGVVLSGVTGGMTLIALMEEGRMEWLRVWFAR